MKPATRPVRYVVKVCISNCAMKFLYDCLKEMFLGFFFKPNQQWKLLHHHWNQELLILLQELSALTASPNTEESHLKVWNDLMLQQRRKEWGGKEKPESSLCS